MAIVNLKSDLFADRDAGILEPDPARKRGRPIVVAGQLTNAGTDSAGSTYHLIDVPADAILDALTTFKVDGWGFATISIGTQTDADALVSVARSAGATVTPIARLGAQHGKPLWQVLGLAEAPKSGVIGIYAHGPANATAAGTMPFELHYRFR
ncbi:MAG: hypothetical protein ACU0FT_04205 [Paracoccus sp. (in: a-proteobacteria)]|uniref:hypothetical protein n=1 Tax=Paracoccus sp. TaxID=267 RepID=UPI0040582B3F